VKNEVEKVPILQLTQEGSSAKEDLVAREVAATIILNEHELVTLLCSPKNLDYLAVGFLASEGLLTSREEIKRVMVDDERGVVRVDTTALGFSEDMLFKRLSTSGCGRGTSFYSPADAASQRVESPTRISGDRVLGLVHQFQHGSEVFRLTGGVHSAALSDTEGILVFHEDIGRHNAIDKVFGECLLREIPVEGRLVITSGRISSEILLKVSKRNIPILISKSAPTDQGVRLADALGITLIGFVRGKRMNIYTNQWRVTTDGE